MKTKALAWLLAAASVLLSLAAPRAVLADDIVVNNNGGGDFTSIQAAIDSAELRLRAQPTLRFVIRVRSSSRPYSGPITPISDVPIIGDSTAGTFIDGGGGGTLINLKGVSSVTISKFTFRNASLALSVQNCSSVLINNNIFDLGTSATAVQVQNSPNDVTIRNNTFFRNGTALNTNSNVVVTNSIFANNQVAISAPGSLTLSYNGFFNNTSNGVTDLGSNFIPNTLRPGNDPRFVDPADRDYHLLEDSPAKGSGNPNFRNSFDNSSDMGAYGGPESDVPLSVTGLSSTFASPNISLTWNQASNSLVRGYRIYYGTATGTYNGTQATEGASSFAAVGRANTSTTLSNLPVEAPPPPPAPAVTLTPRNEALQVEWRADPGAARYLVYFSTEEFSGANLPANPIPVDGSQTSHVIPNLVNGQRYFVAVAAQAQTIFYAAVTAVVDLGLPPDAGSSNESGFSNEISQGVSPAVDGPISALRSETPEAVSPYPNLPNKGCFIATAAYGFYSAPQVQVLRQFRDRYLMSNAPGRAFVAWYYRHGPRAAQFIEAHPWLKPPVRLALMPLIALALFLLKTTALAKIAILALAALAARPLSRRLRRSQSRRSKILVPGGGAQ